MQPLLLDTCALIWIVEDEPVSNEATAALDQAHASGVPTYVSPMSAWEVGLLVSRGRLNLLITPQRWFALALQAPSARLAELSTDLLIASSSLPGKPPRDPADRIIAATARDIGATLITRDRALLDYGDQGYLRVMGC